MRGFSCSQRSLDVLFSANICLPVVRGRTACREREREMVSGHSSSCCVSVSEELKDKQRRTFGLCWYGSEAYHRDQIPALLSEASPSWTDRLLSSRDAILQPLAAGWRAGGGAEGRLQVAERQRPVHRLQDLSSAPPGQSRLAAHVEVHEGWYGLKAVTLQSVLDLNICFAALNHDLPDEEVQNLLLPAAGQDKVAPTGLRVPDEKTAVVQHQALRHLRKHFTRVRGSEIRLHPCRLESDMQLCSKHTSTNRLFQGRSHSCWVVSNEERLNRCSGLNADWLISSKHRGLSGRLVPSCRG